MPEDKGGKDGWLNRHAPGSSLFGSRETGYVWRLVRAQLQDGVLSLWSVPSLGIRAFDPALLPIPRATGNLSAIASGHSGSPYTVSPLLEESALADLEAPVGAMAALSLNVGHASCEAHPDLVTDETGTVAGGSDEALAHYLLFAQAARNRLDTTATALPFCTNFLTTLQLIRGYIDLVASRSMPGADPSEVARRAIAVTRVVLAHYASLVLNPSIHGILQQIAESLSRINNSEATALKLDIYKRYADLAGLVEGDTSHIPPAGDPLSVRVQQLLNSGGPQLWMPPDLFLDPYFLSTLAAQLSLFHQHFWAKWSPISDLSLLFHKSSDNAASEWRLNPLVFDLVSPHFLGTLLANHSFALTLTPAKRGALFSQWIVLGNMLRDLGDIVGWVAIATVMCQLPVLRLREAWAFVNPELRSCVSQEWGFEVFELEKRFSLDILDKLTFRASTEDMGERYPKDRCVPYFGDVIVTDTSPVAHTLVHVEQQLVRMQAVIEGWRFYYDQSPGMEAVAPQPPSDPLYFKLFNNWLHANSRTPSIFPTAADASLAVEPRALGNYLPFHYTQTLPLSNGSFLPILFTESNPSFRLLPKSSLMSSSAIASSSSKRSLRSFNVGAPGTPESTATRKLQRSNSFPPHKHPSTTGVRELEKGTRDYMLNNTSGHVLVRNIRDLLNVGVTTYLPSLDIVLKSTDDDVTRSSRSSSIIENLGRRSVIADNGRQSLQSLELGLDDANTVPVAVKAASVVRLVDILVLGVGEFSLQTSRRRFKIDLPVHTETFLATFRSFCSPTELLRMLEHRFEGAAGAAFSVVHRRTGVADSNEPFPRWGHTQEPLSGQSLRVLCQIYCNIIEALQLWVSEFYFDFADDEVLRTSMRRFLLRVEQTLSDGKFSDTLQAQAKRLSGSFVKQRYKVTDVSSAAQFPAAARHMVHILPLSGDDSLLPLEQYIEDLDTIVADYFSKITLKDWMHLLETLELQVAENNALFNYASANGSNEDELPIQNIFSYFSSLYRTHPGDKILSRLPTSISNLFKLHLNISDYIAYQISDPMMYVVNRSRVSRMTYVLKLLGILKTRMRYFDLFPDSTIEAETSVPSFLESAIVAGILRPESRMFAQAWVQAGNEVAAQFGAARNLPSDSSGQRVPPNSRTIFIPDIPSSLLHSGETSLRPITPCVGWLVERLLEIVCYVPNMSVENQDLINFDKRRYAYNLVKNIHSEFFSRPSTTSAVDKLYMQYDYIINPDVGMYKMNKKAIKEALVTESHGHSKSQLKQRAFSDLIASEQEKLRMEARQLDALKSQKHMFAGIPASSSTSNLSLKERRMSRTRPMSILASSPPHNGGNGFAERDRKSRSRFGAGLLKAVRPLSMAFSSTGGTAGPAGQANQQPQVLPPSSLPNVYSVDTTNQKLQLTIDLADFEVKGPLADCIIKLCKAGNYQEHVLQATSDREAQSWVTKLREGRHAAVARAQARPGSTKVFGVPLELLCQREHVQVPRTVEHLLREVEERGLEEVGLYRISGSLTAINGLKAAFDNGETLKPSDYRWQDINAVAGCVKLYLRELPEPLLTTQLFNEFIRCANIQAKDEQLSELHSCIERLPAPNYRLLSRLIAHLNLVVAHEASNKMSTPNLAIVFSMNFLPPNAMDQMRAMQNIVHTMIVHHEKLFTRSVEPFEAEPNVL